MLFLREKDLTCDVPWFVRSVGLRLELRCETLAVLQAITTPAASLQSFLTELTDGQFSSLRDIEGDPAQCSGQLLSETQPGQTFSVGKDRNSFSTGRNAAAGSWAQARGMDSFEMAQSSAAAVTTPTSEREPSTMGSRLATLSLSDNINSGADSSLSLLRRWRAIKGAADR